MAHEDSFGSLPFGAHARSDFHQQRYPDTTSYDTYPAVSVYSPTPQVYQNSYQYPLEQTKTQAGPERRLTPAGSPSPSVSQTFDHPPSTLSSASGASVQSTASSAVGSPFSHATHSLPGQGQWAESQHGLGLAPEIVHSDGFGDETMYPLSGLETDIMFDECKLQTSFVDPSLIQPFNDTPIAHNTTSAPYPGVIHAFPLPSQSVQPPSPAPSDTSSQDSRHAGPSRYRSNTASPYLHSATYRPYPTMDTRRMSIASGHSRQSHESSRSTSIGFDDDGRERGRCPNPDCGRVFKDLKAHMLTHQSERPEKCPIVTCEYHQKGFARKYDKNRHTLTHYKGTMVCDFCPGSGSAAEKSFNRADVFKRHLTSVHGVEQTPPNSRKKSPSATSSKKSSAAAPDAAGKCSTCLAMFHNAQDFYEHLDDCVLRVVQQEEPSEAINEQRLAEVADDPAVQESLDRQVPTAIRSNAEESSGLDGHDNEVDEFKVENTADNGQGLGSTNIPAGKGVASHVGGGNSAAKSGRIGKNRGMTFSKGGVPLVGKGRKRRKFYPPSWGSSVDKMKMKKRVLCVYDGPRRLWKDDMMLDNEFEVRMRLGDGNAYVTDLDVKTVKRANAFHDATFEEKGPWLEDEVDIRQLMSSDLSA